MCLNQKKICNFFIIHFGDYVLVMDFLAFCIVQNSDLQIMQVTVANLFVCTLLYYTPVSEDLSNEPNFSGVFLFFIIWLLRKPSL